MNTTNKFFKTKEQHLAFRKAFAAAITSPRAKKGKPGPYGNKKKGWITSSHMILQNIVRGLPYSRGFTPMTKNPMIQHGADPEATLFNAKWHLSYAINNAKSYVAAIPAGLSHWEEPKVTKSLLDVFKRKSTIEERNVELEKARQVLIVAKTSTRQEQHLKVVMEFLAPFEGAFTVADLAQIEVTQNE
jgi:hypothetical protein